MTTYNANNVTYGWGIYGDTLAPTPIISSSNVGSGYTNVSPTVITVTFDQPVWNFTAADITVVNGSAAANLVAIGGSVTPRPENILDGYTTYTFEIEPVENATVQITVGNNVCYDGSGIFNLSSNTFEFIYDQTAPTITLLTDGDSDGYINTSTASFSLTWLEPVDGLQVGDFTLVGTGSPVVQNIVKVNPDVDGYCTDWTFDVVGYSTGSTTVTVNANAVYDKAGNFNTGPGSHSFYYDLTQPSVFLSSGSIIDGYTNVTFPFVFQTTFTDDVPIDSSTFDVSDFTISNGTVYFKLFNGTNWDIYVNGITDGPVTIELPANKVKDLAGNDNTGSNVLSFYYDKTRPAVSINSAEIVDGYANQSPVQFTATFTDTGSQIKDSTFTSGDIAVTNGTATNLAGTGNNWTFDVIPSGQGLVTVAISPNLISDNAGNLNTGSNTISFTYDSVHPTPVITSSTVVNGGLTTSLLINFQVTFDESVTGFTVDDIDASGGTISNFAGSGTTYTFDLAVVDGAYTVDIPSGAGKDAANNNSNPAAQFTFTVSTSISNISGNISGTRTNEVWVYEVILTGNVIIPNGVTVVVDPDCVIIPQQYSIIVQNGGTLNTGTKRLPYGSAIGSRIIFT
jgi:hypothetical protein